MYCQEVSQKLNQFVDGELSPLERRIVQKHLQACPLCERHVSELELVCQAFSSPIYLPEGSRRRMRQSLLARTRRHWTDTPYRLFRQCKAVFSDLDRQSALYRLCALPLSLAFLFVLASQLPRLPVQQWTFPVYADEPGARAASGGRPPVLVQVLQSNSSVDELVDAAWKIPYEDSFSLVAGISPDGNARIQNVLEYPRAMELLDAVDLTLRESQFDGTSEMSHAFLIYSFQKIDVYEGL